MPESPSARRVLIVDDEELFRASAAKRLKNEGLVVFECASADEALQVLEKQPLDLALVDVRLPDGDGLELTERIRGTLPTVPVILLTAYSSVDNAVDAIRRGAYDYLTKPVTMEKLIVTVHRALETQQLRRVVSRVRREEKRRFGISGIVAKDPAMLKVLDLVREVAQSDAKTILLRGESGSGKSLIARAIHTESPRADRPFVQIICTTLQDTLLESELFGHERGAFTDAKSMKRGLFEVGDGGTIFLDEISEMSERLQAKLLQVLDEQYFRRIGGVDDIYVNVRVIAATNRDLEQLVRDGKFREDLYYRLNVIPIVVPPLRERKRDIAELTRRFVKQYNREFRKSIEGVSPKGMEMLVAHRWPGNVRELKNTIERAVLLAKGPRLEPDDLVTAPPLQASGQVRFRLPPGGIVLEEVERDFLVQALEMAEGSLSKAARLLGITKDTLRYRIKKFGLKGGTG